MGIFSDEDAARFSITCLKCRFSGQVVETLSKISCPMCGSSEVSVKGSNEAVCQERL